MIKIISPSPQSRKENYNPKKPLMIRCGSCIKERSFFRGLGSGDHGESIQTLAFFFSP